MPHLFSRIDTVVLRVQNLEAREWYKKVLGLQTGFVGEGEEKYIVYTVGGGTSLTILERKANDHLSAPRSIGAYPIFFADDIGKTHKELQDRGVDVGSLQIDHPNEYFVIHNPDGNRLEVCHWE